MIRVPVLISFTLLQVFLTEGTLHPARETGTMEEISSFIPTWKTKTERNLRPVEVQAGYRRKTVWSPPVVSPSFEVRRTLLKAEKIPSEQIVLLDAAGQPEKIYDLFHFKKIKMVATAYWVGDPQVPGTITYSGHSVRRGLVAVDPAVISLGTRLYVPGYGYAYTSDTGSAIKGRRIDLFVEDKRASRPWEHKSVDVYVLEKAAKW